MIRHKKQFRLKSRSSGVLLHPTSLPSRFGIGDLGSQAYQFVDFLAESFQQVWQVLPIGTTGYGNSPYSSYSALAGNPLLISPETLIEENLLSVEDCQDLPEFPLEKVDYELVIATKIPLLKKACENFKQRGSHEQKEEFDNFSTRQSYWLDDFALFMALKEVHDGATWNNWEKEIAFRKPEAIIEWTSKLVEEIFEYKFLQFLFFRQWKKLKEYANESGVTIFGDIPIYVAHDSVDVWCNPQYFALDEDTGAVALMAGVPPDYFSATGQLWGNPVYDWEALEEDNFDWWVQRIKGMLEYVDLIRIDHFRGFQAYWGVEQGSETAMNGTWLEAPGEALFKEIRERLGSLPFIAEDLGEITPDVIALRDKFEFPGLKILQFAFDYNQGNPFVPYNYTTSNCVVYTGTHDNNTTVGWFEELSPEEKSRVTDYLGCVCPEGIAWSLIRLGMSTIANLAIFPLQDILGLGTEAKMNTPSQGEGNWQWRFVPGSLTHELREQLKHLTILYGRHGLD